MESTNSEETARLIGVVAIVTTLFLLVMAIYTSANTIEATTEDVYVVNKKVSSENTYENALKVMIPETSYSLTVSRKNSDKTSVLDVSHSTYVKFNVGDPITINTSGTSASYARDKNN